MTEQVILNMDGLPFGDIIVADEIAAILSRETGATYMVTRHLDGYGLLCRPLTSSSSSGQSSANNLLSHHVEEMYFRPAWRSQLMSMLRIFLSIFLYIFTDSLLKLMGVDGLYNMLSKWQPVDWQVLVNTMSWVALGFAVYFGLLMLYAIYSQKYFVGPKGVEACIGLVSKDQTRIEFKHMRGVNLKQSVIERFLGLIRLGYGTIEIATSGSDGAEVRFQGIANPKNLLAVLRDRLKTSA
ncbi:MAG: PH domain-containing protein [Gammaproteobacteria bacterium]|nr:PH domain-containing protein [Gammaproteobacteria bacterium]